MEHGEDLPGKAGNYRIAKFPGTERILFKTNFSKAFKDKAWYPKTFILPEEKAGGSFCLVLFGGGTWSEKRLLFEA